MMIQEVLQQRRTALLKSIRASAGIVLHSDAWLMRVLDPAILQTVLPPERIAALCDIGGTTYEGFPRVAAMGYVIGAAEMPSDSLCQSFSEGISRLRQRSGSGQAPLAGDDVALLGLADALAKLTEYSSIDVSDARLWLLRIIADTRESQQWSMRMRALAGDLLDHRGRLRVLSEQMSTDALALELVLRALWPQVFAGIPIPQYQPQLLLRTLILDTFPDDSERSATWLRCLDLVINDTCASLTHTISDTSRVLMSIQHALKRWSYEEKAHRHGIAPIRWIIDDEYDVQSLLWSILYPIYREMLVDETYLPNWGNVQPRADLGITNLKLIIEVKIARRPGDFADIEEQVAGDIGLYFKDISLFDRMLVFIYDDCDKHHPEKYESLRNALKQRVQIEDVIIVRRPGMLPNRNER
jgi:hypothetical protein